MVLSRWLQKQIKNMNVWQQLNERLHDLEKGVEELRSQKEKQTEATGAPTIIEYINIEKIVVDRYEQSNNFGALGIKSLEGRLNIGANYGMSENIPEDKKKTFEDKLKKTSILYKENKQKNHANTKTPPKTTIRSRSGDAS